VNLTPQSPLSAVYVTNHNNTNSVERIELQSKSSILGPQPSSAVGTSVLTSITLFHVDEFGVLRDTKSVAGRQRCNGCAVAVGVCWASTCEVMLYFDWELVSGGFFVEAAVRDVCTSSIACCFAVERESHPISSRR
jgi:hypothetical protein